MKTFDWIFFLLRLAIPITYTTTCYSMVLFLKESINLVMRAFCLLHRLVLTEGPPYDLEMDASHFWIVTESLEGNLTLCLSRNY
jgi:hypothetical protein